MNTYDLCATIIPFNLKRKGFSDLTGDFSHNSSRESRRNLYVMVMYDYDSNVILAEPIKNGQAATIRDAFLKVHKVLKSRGIDPQVCIMDNRCSNNFKYAMENMR